MMGWLAEPTTLPRWVVWAALLTSPAVWSRQFAALVRKRFQGGTPTD